MGYAFPVKCTTCEKYQMDGVYSDDPSTFGASKCYNCGSYALIHVGRDEVADQTILPEVAKDNWW